MKAAPTLAEQQVKSYLQDPKNAGQVSITAFEPCYQPHLRRRWTRSCRKGQHSGRQGCRGRCVSAATVSHITCGSLLVFTYKVLPYPGARPERNTARCEADTPILRRLRMTTVSVRARAYSYLSGCTGSPAISARATCRQCDTGNERQQHAPRRPKAASARQMGQRLESQLSTPVTPIRSFQPGLNVANVANYLGREDVEQQVVRGYVVPGREQRVKTRR